MEASFCSFRPRSKPASAARGAHTSHSTRTSGSARTRRHARTSPAPARLPSAAPAFQASTPSDAAGPRREGARGAAGARAASQSRAGTQGLARESGASRANPLAGRALAGREARALTPHASPPSPRAPLRRRAGPGRRGRSGAAKRPGRVGSRRKDARALGGGEVIKGKEPAAGGSGRFSCGGRCCLAFGPPEGRSLEGRRCRPQ